MLFLWCFKYLGFPKFRIAQKTLTEQRHEPRKELRGEPRAESIYYPLDERHEPHNLIAGWADILRDILPADIRAIKHDKAYIR